jgi:Protein of unknown function (DUF2628)
MARYVVMQKQEDAAGAMFVRDGFSLPALIVPHLWLLFYRQWLAAAAVIGAMVLGALAAWQWGAPLIAVGTDILISLYVALEGATLRIANLERDGFSEAAIVEAATREEAEIRYYGTLPESALTFTPPASSAFGRPSNNAFAFPQRG